VATIYDVAREASVSTATVSRALRGRPEVLPEVRQRVLAVADRLGYRPNRLAQALARTHANALGLMLPADISHPFYGILAESVARHAIAYGYELVVGLPALPSVESYVEAAVDLQDRRIAGLLVCANSKTIAEYARNRRAGAPPLVALGCLPDVDVPLVTADEEAAGHELTQHLIDLAHRRIGFLGLGPEEVRPSGREHGYLRAVTEAGLPSVLRGADRTMEGGREGAIRLLEGSPGLTAIIAHNDAVALGALRGLFEAGVRVPEDIAVAGFDNIPQSRYSIPALTTVDLSAEEMAQRGLEMLGRHLGFVEGEPDGRLLITPQLVIRDSSGPARS